MTTHSRIQHQSHLAPPRAPNTLEDIAMRVPLKPPDQTPDTFDTGPAATV